MKETALFVGWGGTYPGREHTAFETEKVFTEILEELKAKGEIEDYIPVLLGPHGGELDGFTLIIGDEMNLMQLAMREDLHRLQLRAEREHAKFSVIPAVIGERVGREYKIVEEEILPIFDRTPVTV